MKQDQVEIGRQYIAKVSDRLVPVRIDGKHQRGGWYAVNMRTGKTIQIKSAQRLHGPASNGITVGEAARKLAARAMASQTPTEPTPAVSAAVQTAIERDAAANAHAVDPTRIPTEAPTTPTKARNAANQPTAKGLSGLDAAAQVLADAGEPMRCGDIVRKMLETGLWFTGGATPVATISAAMQREIKTKGETARFKKADRGLFILNTK